MRVNVLCTFLLVLVATTPLIFNRGAAASGVVDDAERGYFSARQSERGRASYAEACGECHKTSEFRGDEFEWRWRRQTAWNLFKEVSTSMPEDDPGQLQAQTYADIVAYLLDLNDYQAGEDDLTPTEQALSAIPLGAGAIKVRPAGEEPD